MEIIKQDEEQFPSVDLAYEFVSKSYEWAQQRIDKVDDRIQALIAWVSSTDLAVLAIITTKRQSLNFTTKWFWAFVIFYVIGLILSWYARLYGSLRVINLKLVYEKSLGLSPWEFKRDMIFFAGQAFEQNKSLIQTKSRFAMASIIFFLAQALALAIWAVRG